VMSRLILRPPVAQRESWRPAPRSYHRRSRLGWLGLEGSPGGITNLMSRGIP
jgi:hypothetical protein